MAAQNPPAHSVKPDLIFVENAPLDLEQLIALFTAVGWNRNGWRTPDKMALMLRHSRYYVAAVTAQGQIVGFARVCGDREVAQVADVATHPHFRHQGVATSCMAGVLQHLNQSDYQLVTLFDQSGLDDFYQRFGFQATSPTTTTRIWQRHSASHPLPTPTTTPTSQKQTKTIGILGGISHESTTQYYERLHQKYFDRYHDYHYPEVVIYSLDFQRFTDLENSADRVAYITEIMKGIYALEGAGVDFILMAANSPHMVFDEVARRATVPLVSIVTETIRIARALHLRHLLLLGIKVTMQADFYQRACIEANIEVITPALGEQDQINAIIFDELVRGIFNPETKQALLDIIARYPVDGVILGCTELPLILPPQDLSLPAIDTLDAHVEAALRYALS